jgi:hypothetical protein
MKKKDMPGSAGLVCMFSFVMLTGCGTVISDGGRQPATVSVEIESLNKQTSNKYIKEIIITDNNDDGKQFKVGAGDVFYIHQGSQPMKIELKESDCILPATAQVNARTNGFFFLNMLWGELSTFSSSTDSSNGTNWRYFPADRVIKTKVKDTPECQEWLKKVSVTDSYVTVPVPEKK